MIYCQEASGEAGPVQGSEAGAPARDVHLHHPHRGRLPGALHHVVTLPAAPAMNLIILSVIFLCNNNFNE